MNLHMKRYHYTDLFIYACVLHVWACLIYIYTPIYSPIYSPRIYTASFSISPAEFFQFVRRLGVEIEACK